MKRKIQKKLILSKVTIATHQIFGGSLDPNTSIVPTPSSAFHEPTEPPELNPIVIINTVDPEDPTLISGNQQTCM
jgi:hypothetical protein